MVGGPSPWPSPRSGGERGTVPLADIHVVEVRAGLAEVLMRGRARSEGLMFESPYVVSYARFEEEDEAEAEAD
jgi:hypothetical protein